MGERVLPKVGPIFMTEARYVAGLNQLVAYLHLHGVTAFNEPGILWDQEPYVLYQQILGRDDVPILSTFMVDGRSQSQRGLTPQEAIIDAEEQIARVPKGRMGLFDKQIKLFADGAIISQMMEMKDPYLDDAGEPDPCHHGEWLMTPELLEDYARAYWQAGWQIHTHVNGDIGLEVLLGILERCQADFPREDHRSVIVHFANSTDDQVDRIAGGHRLGQSLLRRWVRGQVQRPRSRGTAGRHHGAICIGGETEGPAVLSLRPPDGTIRSPQVGCLCGQPGH